jgi:phosphoesterase RecJ-like protein
MQNWDELKQLLATSKKVLILSHRSPDGDSIGSSLGLGGALKLLGHHVQVITPDPAPRFLSWMLDFESILNFEQHEEASIKAVGEAELIFCLDFNTLSRLGEGLCTEVQKNQNAFLLNIDHHQNPDDFANFQLVDTTASSTAQLVYTFISKIGEEELISKAIGACLYTGILTDTGSFKFSSTSATTHKVAAELIEKGVVPHEIHEKVYDNYTADRLKLLGFALSERLKLYPEYRTGIIYLSEKDLQQFHFQKGDTEGLVNYPLSIGNVRMAILITEKDGKVKLSFRSKGDFRVNELAGKYFSGGGHINAAGGISQYSVLETLEKIEELLPQYELELNA